jgi:hypothetical protein
MLLISSILDADKVYEELVLSYSVIFSRDARSKQIAKKLFASRKLEVVFVDQNTREVPPGTVIITKWESYFEGQSPMLSHFERYRGHFAFLKKEMDEWKPQTIKELLQPGYKDRLTWYATMFGILIAILGFIGTVTGIISAVTGWIAMNAALKALEIQMLQG